ncbi:hypothetical protein HGM15179_021367, partial [Zosterops borbonicus]
IVNVRQIQEVFRQFKVILSQQEEEVESRLWNKYRLGQRDITSDSASDSSSDLCLPEPEEEQEEEEEEEDDTSFEFPHEEFQKLFVDKDEDLDEVTLETESPPSSPIPGEEREGINDDG